VFERLRAAVNAALDAAMPPPDWRDLVGQMRRAAVEGRAAILKLEEALRATQQALAREEQQLADARRRGGLADDIGDRETVEVAGRFTAKHAERVAVLEQKLAAQRAELALAERDVGEMVAQLKELELRGGVPRDGARVMPDPLGPDDAMLGAELDRAAKDAAADERLRELKKRMGR
jgi:hypothetical protein